MKQTDGNQQFKKQLKFIAYLLDQGSDYTFSNARRSALRAGYSDSYARKITSYLDWQKMELALLEIRNELRRIIEGADKNTLKDTEEHED